MNKILIIPFLLLVFVLQGQQDEHFTQFMYNKTYFNPGHAGSNDAPCFTLTSRNQWLGLEGAPQTQMLSFNMPLFNKRVGAGATLSRQTIGVSELYTADAVYAYRIPIGRGMLGMGLQGGIRFFRADYNKVTATQPVHTDDAIPNNLQSKYIPNFGAGIYYTSHMFFIGASVPRILENNIDLSDAGGVISKEVRHIYFMGGFILDLNDNVQIQPQLLLKYVENVPFDADINTNLVFSDKITCGLSYRIGGSKESGIGESISLVLGAQATESILFGLSYDYTLSELNNYSNGTVEAIVRYCIGGRKASREYISPRFF